VLRIRQSLSAILLLSAAGCLADDPGAGDAASSTAHLSVDSLHPMLRPVSRRERFYVDPATNEAELTIVLGVRIDASDRFVLAQSPEDGGDLIIVADSARRILAFTSLDEARAYAARVFPDAGDVHAELLASMGVNDVRVDLDAVRGWTREPQSNAIGPFQVSLTWDVLAGAGAAPARLPFDPMGMYGLAESLGRGDIDSLSFGIATVGMKVGGFVTAARMSGPTSKDRFPDDESIWSAPERAMLADLLTRGIEDFGRRLSADATRSDVKETWPSPAPARLLVKLSGNSNHELWLRPPSDDLGEPQLPAKVASRVGEAEPRGSVSASAYARYLTDRKDYARDLSLYLRQQYKFENAAHRVVPLDVTIANQGDKRADDVTIVFHIPAGMTFVTEDIRQFNYQMPDEPRRPAEYENPSFRRTPYVPAERVLRAGSAFRDTAAVQLSDGSWTLERRVHYGIAAHDADHVYGVFAQYPDWQSVSPFEFGVEVRSSTGDPVRTQLRINATVAR
jgi:hypothetical protein